MIEYIEKETARRIINSPRTKEQMLAMLEGSRTMALPKHHGRLIDVNELLDDIGLEDNDENRDCNNGEIITLENIDRISTIIPATKEGDGEC